MEPNMEWEKEFVEKGAELEHDRWARWQKYMFSKGVVGPDGEFHLPEEFVDRWFRQIDTPYSELSESEKESDRKETRNYLSLIRQAISEAEIHGFCNAQNGYAEVVKKLSDDVEKAEQRGYERGAAEERRRISEALKFDLFPVQIREENPRYWYGYSDTTRKVLSIIHDTK